MAYVRLSDYVFDCKQCDTRCDGVSKGVYRFDSDVAFSEHYEQAIIARINRSATYTAAKCAKPGFPDIEIANAAGVVVRYLEVKVQQRTFMQVESLLPAAALAPSETVALNESDLLRYFQIEDECKMPITIVWVLMNRLCMLPAGTHLFFYQQLTALRKIYAQYGAQRRFRRRSGEGDIVDGKHKGVTVNYHFSLKELNRWSGKL